MLLDVKRTHLPLTRSIVQKLGCADIQRTWTVGNCGKLVNVAYGLPPRPKFVHHARYVDGTFQVRAAVEPPDHAVVGLVTGGSSRP